MRRCVQIGIPLALTLIAPFPLIHAQHDKAAIHAEFRTSDRCVACHNGLKTPSGEDISIGLQWSASIMANSSRDPYWQGSVRRESMDHPKQQPQIENECSTCHMPAVHFADRDSGRMTQVFSHLPLKAAPNGNRSAASDGVTCSVCHQIEKYGLGTPETFVGNLKFEKPKKGEVRPEYGPFDIDTGHREVMRSSTGGFQPQNGDQIREAGLCGSCHTLITHALGPQGQEMGTFPEQVPFQEWEHSDYVHKETCQDCHMPEVKEAVAITSVFGPLRKGMRRHVFVGGNFLVLAMLQEHRKNLATVALPQELEAAIQGTKEFLQTRSAKLTVRSLAQSPGRVEMIVLVQNLTGRKLPTAYPSRRAWLHVTLRDEKGRVVFESGALRANGSIVGNANDDNPTKYEPYYSTITQPDQVEIYEPILKDYNGHVTTALLKTIGYLKDDRLLPDGFDKKTAPADIAVWGRAANDPGFTGNGSLVRYEMATGNDPGPFQVTVELWYQPIGYRWAHNFESYFAHEPKRFLRYYEEDARKSGIVLAHAEAETSADMHAESRVPRSSRH